MDRRVKRALHCPTIEQPDQAGLEWLRMSFFSPLFLFFFPFFVFLTGNVLNEDFEDGHNKCVTTNYVEQMGRKYIFCG